MNLGVMEKILLSDIEEQEDGVVENKDVKRGRMVPDGTRYEDPGFNPPMSEATLLDFFAGKALAGMLMDLAEGSFEDMAVDAYRQADAMLEYRAALMTGRASVHGEVG